MSKLGNNFRTHKRAWYGVIGAITIVIVLIGITIYAGANIGKRTYTGAFDQAGGVRSGDEVRVAGIEVGEVSDTELDGHRVIITMKVDRDVEVADDGYGTIKLSTLLGQRYIDLTLGTSAEPAPDGEIGKKVGNKAPYDLQQTIEAGTPVLAGINEDDLAESIDTLNEQLADAPAVAAPTF